MNISPTIQKALIYLCVVLFLGYLGYSLFTSPVTDESFSGAVSSEVMGQDIIDLVENLKMISLDKTIFTSVVFTSLIDYSVPISPEIQGRSNPFAPIGSDGSTSFSPKPTTPVNNTTQNNVTTPRVIKTGL